MTCRLNLEHPVQLEGTEYSAKVTALEETGRKTVVVSSVRGRCLKPKEVMFKEGKGINSVKCSREGRHW